MAATTISVGAAAHIQQLARKAALLASTAVATVAWTAGPVSPARAVDTTFTGANGTADWTDGANWDTNQAATNADKALVTTAGKSASITAAGAGVAASVTIGAANPVTVTSPASTLGVAGGIDINDGSLTATNSGVVTAGGTLAVTKGTVVVNTA